MFQKALIVIVSVVTIAAGVVTAEQATKTPTTQEVSGAWNLSIDSPHGKMVWEMSLKTSGRTVTGTVGNAQMGSFELKGAFADGKLTFTFGPAERTFEFNGKLKDANTLVGTLTSETGDMACVAERVK